MAESSSHIVVLVVEDEPFVRMIAADILVEQGIIVSKQAVSKRRLE